MAQAIAQILPFAAGIMVSPIPIVAVILMLFTRRATVNGPAFLAGWAAGLTVVSVVGYAAASALGWGDGSEESATEVTWWRVILGVALLGLAVRKWRGVHDPDHTESMPGWMADIDELRPVKALGLGALLSANPKNLILALGAVTGLARLDAPANEVAVAIATFVVVASLGVAAAVGYRLLGGEKAQRSLEVTRGWLQAHNDAVMTALYLVFGVVLISNGLGG